MFILEIRKRDILSCDYGFISNGTYCEQCGLSYINPNVKIVGGVSAIPYSWPSYVAIKINIKNDYVFPDNQTVTVETTSLCGGTLINHYTVLTAA